MHASIWRFRGDPDELMGSYEALLAEVPAESMRLHLCLRAEDGIVLVDTCPSKEAFDAFFADEGFRSMLKRAGLPDPVQVEDFPAEVAFVDGARR